MIWIFHPDTHAVIKLNDAINHKSSNSPFGAALQTEFNRSVLKVNSRKCNLSLQLRKIRPMQFLYSCIIIRSLF